jgi:hypothetical protein
MSWCFDAAREALLGRFVWGRNRLVAGSDIQCDVQICCTWGIVYEVTHNHTGEICCNVNVCICHYAVYVWHQVATKPGFIEYKVRLHRSLTVQESVSKGPQTESGQNT